jgi:hypothetical protein
MRLEEAERDGYGFDLPDNPTAAVVPIVPKNWKQKSVEVAAQVEERAGIKMVDVTGIEPVTPCLQSRCSPS